jgi:hypothetical protein|uniref:Uncharacterized protein n=1 Tax=viral metagenome TaxID=1070528 RepID=A0A6C0IMD1_9ZZZZ
MATQLNTTNHDALNTEMSNLFKSGCCCGVKMSIFTDTEATVLATDSNGEIKDRKVAQILKTASYTNPANNQVTKANIKIKFSDGSMIVSTDDIDTYYYKLCDEEFTHRKF